MQTHEAPTAEERAAAIGDNIARLQSRMAEIAVEAGRDPQSVKLHGATKGVEPERVIAAIQHGLTHFGENWVQEAAPKIAAANALADEQGITPPTWHMIGHLQRNKTRQALQVFQAIDTVDSLRLAETISQRAEQMDVGPIGALIEIDFTDNPDRGGFKLGLAADDGGLARFHGGRAAHHRTAELECDWPDDGGPDGGGRGGVPPGFPSLARTPGRSQ